MLHLPVHTEPARLLQSASCSGTVQHLAAAKEPVRNAPHRTTPPTIAILKIPLVQTTGAHIRPTRENAKKFKQDNKIINVKDSENIFFPELQKRSASFPLGKSADSFHQGAKRRLV